MTISSSLNAGVAGLSANATRLATISDNIANSGTYGYKRANTEFESFVIGGNAGAACIPPVAYEPLHPALSKNRALSFPRLTQPISRCRVVVCFPLLQRFHSTLSRVINR